MQRHAGDCNAGRNKKRWCAMVVTCQPLTIAIANSAITSIFGHKRADVFPNMYTSALWFLWSCNYSSGYKCLFSRMSYRSIKFNWETTNKLYFISIHHDRLRLASIRNSSNPLLKFQTVHSGWNSSPRGLILDLGITSYDAGCFTLNIAIPAPKPHLQREDKTVRLL